MNEAVGNMVAQLVKMEKNGIVAIKPDQLRFMIDDVCMMAHQTHGGLPTQLLQLFDEVQVLTDDPRFCGGQPFKLSELAQRIACMPKLV